MKKDKRKEGQVPSAAPKKEFDKKEKKVSFLQKIQSRKLIVLMAAIILFLIHPEHFTGLYLVYIMLAFISSNILQKFIEVKK